MNSHKNTPSPPNRFVDTASNENLVDVYERNVRFNFYLEPGERKVYLDAMRARGMDIQKYLKDETVASQYQEINPLSRCSTENKVQHRVTGIIDDFHRQMILTSAEYLKK
jgi:hypothetical protein